MNRLLSLIAAALGLSLTLAPSTGLAATVSDPFQVSAEVQNACSVSASDLNFGTYNHLSPNVFSNSTITLNCTLLANVNIALDYGNHFLGGSPTRRMADGTNTLFVSYNLYFDATLQMEWGDGQGFGFPLPEVGQGVPENLTVYGVMPGGQTGVLAGSYTDQVTVTVTY